MLALLSFCDAHFAIGRSQNRQACLRAAHIGIDNAEHVLFQQLTGLTWGGYGGFPIQSDMAEP